EFNVYLPGYSNWACLALNFSEPFYELAITGKEAKKKIIAINQDYLPNKIIIGSTTEKTTLPLLENKWIDGQTTFYVCENKVCQLPVTEVEKAKVQILSQ
ncbi:MAG: thioredoxin domain-containing protein, partial [Flavobacteriales bacterium]|nr:thioredoxin domain-containing protein [Flavobacteriales bacterium]